MGKDEALKQALEALEKIAYVTAMNYEYQRWAREAITVITAALAQPAQELRQPLTETTHEQHIALREAFAIGAAGSYFEANPAHGNHFGRMLFERGFVRGFDSYNRAIEAAHKGAKP